MPLRFAPTEQLGKPTMQTIQLRSRCAQIDPFHCVLLDKRRKTDRTGQLEKTIPGGMSKRPKKAKTKMLL
jgi:hypothetical protein